MTVNQANFQDNQAFDIDIEKIYNDFIKEIDSIRSYVNFNNNNIDNVFKSLVNKSNTSNNIVAELTYQESRVHAFYRMIGFPVVSKDKKIYNPGLDIINPERIEEKVEIAKNPIDGFNKISNERETYLNNILKTFANPTLEASVLSLTSGSVGKSISNIRTFNASIEKLLDGFDTEVENQSYKIPTLSLIGNNEVDLKSYKTNNKTVNSNIFGNKKHILAPFIVDARIDVTVSPKARLVAVPFVRSQADTNISPEIFVKRPLLEKIIRTRFSQSSKESDTGTSSESIINYIKEVSAIKDQDIISQVNKDLYKLSPQYQFVKYISIIKEMVKKLLDATSVIHKAQSLYYWVPLNKGITGPETLADVRGVFLLNKDENNQYVTDADFNLLMKIVQSQMNQLNPQADPNKTLKNSEGFVFSSTFDNDASSALGDRIQDSLDNLTNKRKKILLSANKALRTIEIIMGEFSGLGLCDIIAILATLHIMPKDNLLGFLDDQAFNRMKVELNLELESIAHPSIDVSMNSFFNILRDIYNLIDRIYEDSLSNNGLKT